MVMISVDSFRNEGDLKSTGVENRGQISDFFQSQFFKFSLGGPTSDMLSMLAAMGGLGD